MPVTSRWFQWVSKVDLGAAYVLKSRSHGPELLIWSYCLRQQLLSSREIDDIQQLQTTMQVDQTPSSPAVVAFVHPIYARDEFPKDIEWGHAFYDAATLATR